ncbi:MAG: nucleotidyltransferase family protein [Ruthenibacterium sp.]
MRVAGIVAEYNPFHNGHAHQLSLLRAQGFDAAVCVCSPSVVQRGTAALLPTAVRTRAALLGGADLVLSLPAPYAVLSAEGFAAAGVRLLSALGICEVIAFGAENADTAQLMQAAAVLQSDAFAQRLQTQPADGAPFAAVRAAVAEQLQPGLGALLSSPNNILGVEYCKALRTLAASGTQSAGGALLARPLALPREGAPHDAPLCARGAGCDCSGAGCDVFGPNTNLHAHAAPGAQSGARPSNAAEYAARTAAPAAHAPLCASATALRTLFLQRGAAALAPYVPAACLALYTQAAQRGLYADGAAFSTAVLSRLRAMRTEDFAAIRGINEGLEHRLAAAVAAAPTLDALYDTLKTKRYAHARMRRLVLDAALGYTCALPAAVPYLHILGASETGLAVLRAAKSTAVLPLSQSLSQLAATSDAARAVAKAHAAAEDLTALCLHAPQPQGSAYTQKFIGPNALPDAR